jgi:hypothetical protein
MESAPLPFAAIEHDPHVAPVLEVPAQLLVPIQTAASDDEDQHAGLESIVVQRSGAIRRSPPVGIRKSLNQGNAV